MDPLGHLIGLVLIPANKQVRAQVEKLPREVQEAIGSNVELAYVDQDYTVEAPREAADEQGIACPW